MSNENYQRLSPRELDEELEALEERLSRTTGQNRIKNLFRNLRRHHLELETQNREMREMAAALDDSRDRLADLYDYAPVGYMTMDRRGIVREINLTGASMLEKTPAELVDRPLSLRLEPDYSRAFFQHLIQVFNGPVKDTVELAMRVWSTRPLWVLLESVRVRSGSETLCRTAMLDVSRRRRMEADLKRNQKNLWQLTEAIPLPIAYFDRNMRFCFANMTCQRWFGLDLERVKGRKVHELMARGSAGFPWTHVRRALDGEEVSFDYTVAQPGNGRANNRITFIPDLDDTGASAGLFAVITDIDEREGQPE